MQFSHNDIMLNHSKESEDILSAMRSLRCNAHLKLIKYEVMWRLGRVSHGLTLKTNLEHEHILDIINLSYIISLIVPTWIHSFAVAVAGPHAAPT